jgi:hypothetical protein
VDLDQLDTVEVVDTSVTCSINSCSHLDIRLIIGYVLVRLMLNGVAVVTIDGVDVNLVAVNEQMRRSVERTVQDVLCWSCRSNNWPFVNPTHPTFCYRLVDVASWDLCLLGGILQSDAPSLQLSYSETHECP